MAALVLEGLLVLVLLTMGSGIMAPDRNQPSLTSISVEEPPEPVEPPEAQAAEAAATAPDYATLAALQRVLVALGRKCRVVIVEPNPRDAASA